MENFFEMRIILTKRNKKNRGHFNKVEKLTSIRINNSLGKLK